MHTHPLLIPTARSKTQTQTQTQAQTEQANTQTHIHTDREKPDAKRQTKANKRLALLSALT